MKPRNRAVRVAISYACIAAACWALMDWLDQPRHRNRLTSPEVLAIQRVDNSLQDEINGLWKRIETALLQHGDAGDFQLRPPATEAELAELEFQFGCKLPGDLKASLRVHNGAAKPFLSENRLFSADEIVEQQKRHFQSKAGYRPDPLPAEEPVGVTSDWRPGWVPVAGWGDSVTLYGLFIDAESSTVYGYGEYYAVDQTSAWKRWLENVARRLESGEFQPGELHSVYWTNTKKYWSPGSEEAGGFQ
ncbi:SMI1/KNR4 family protein [bacterium]|nr:SMI1/KNR4 family protein [bacterium]